jgi:hypothetical protein
MSFSWASAGWVRFAKTALAVSARGGMVSRTAGRTLALGSVGLQRPQLMGGSQERAFESLRIAGQAVEFGAAGVVGKWVEVAVEQRRFEDADAAKVPGGVDDLIEKGELEGALWAQVLLV